MSIGYVRGLGNSLIPFHAIYVEGPRGGANTYLAVIDTGFTGQLALPRTMRNTLDLEYFDTVNTRFGNSFVELVDRFRATIYWNGDWQQITVFEIGDRPLIGMDLLRGSNVCFDAVDLGEIEINPIDSVPD